MLSDSNKVRKTTERLFLLLLERRNLSIDNWDGALAGELARPSERVSAHNQLIIHLINSLSLSSSPLSLPLSLSLLIPSLIHTQCPSLFASLSLSLPSITHQHTLSVPLSMPLFLSFFHTPTHSLYLSLCLTNTLSHLNVWVHYYFDRENGNLT